MAKTLDDVVSILERMDGRLERMDHRMMTTEEELGALKAEVAGLTESVSVMTDGVLALRGEATALATVMLRVVDQHDARLKRLEAEVFPPKRGGRH